MTAPRPPYTVSVRRTSPAQGTGRHELGPVSTNYLSANNRIALEELLHNARFFDLPPRLPLVEVVPGDVLQEITVGNKEVTRTVVYERDGARRPKELDEIVAMLERLAGWQTIRQSAALPRTPGQSAWTPTGTVAPLGASAFRATEAYPPVGPTGVTTGPHGFYPGSTNGQTAQLPPGAPPPGGLHHSGPHTGGYPQQFANSQQTGPSPTMPRAGGAKKWILIALAAVLVIAGGTTAAVLLTRPDPGPLTPAAPAGLTATANGRDVTVTWSGSPVPRVTRSPAAATPFTPASPPDTPTPNCCPASTTTRSPHRTRPARRRRPALRCT